MELNKLVKLNILVLTISHFGAGFLVTHENFTGLFDEELYQRVLDPEECSRQLNYLGQNDTSLLTRFFDAGFRLPSGIFLANMAHLGNYHQCLNIKEQRQGMFIEGKYAYTQLSLGGIIDSQWNLDMNIPEMIQSQNVTNLKQISLQNGEIANVQKFGFRTDYKTTKQDPFIVPMTDIENGLCIPKVCTTQDWVRFKLFNLTGLENTLTEIFVRLPNDKPWAAADYVTIVIFPLIGFVTLLSTLYDVNHTVIQKRDPETANAYGRIFSLYTNTKRLLHFPPNSNAIQCLDGIRSMSIMWVIIAHAFSMHNFNSNLLEVIQWLTSADAVWITTGWFSVDTFFFMSGLLLVYTTMGKMSGTTLLKNLHLFYLNRLLRMFPLLAAAVLLEASTIHRIADGPYWTSVARLTYRCRTYWWSALLHIQNYVNPNEICLPHSWYLSIDFQLHILSPLILFWVLNKSKKGAWAALISALLAILTAATIWNFIRNFPSTNTTVTRAEELLDYMRYYYFNTLTRGAPFFVGMILGYILNLYKGKNIELNKVFVIISTIISLFLIGSCFYMLYLVMKLDWDNQLVDNLFNSFMRTVWALGLSWLIFACVKGYGGPINWLLSLPLWKLPARISYAMYLYHYPMMFVVAGTRVAPVYFSQGERIYEFMSLYMLTIIIAFVMTLVIDAPFSTIIKMLLERGQEKRPPAKRTLTKI